MRASQRDKHSLYHNHGIARAKTFNIPHLKYDIQIGSPCYAFVLFEFSNKNCLYTYYNFT